MSPKPVYDCLHSLIKGKWQTNTTGQTNAHGEFKIRAFFGTQRVTIKTPSGASITKDCAWRRNDPNRFELRFA